MGIIKSNNLDALSHVFGRLVKSGLVFLSLIFSFSLLAPSVNIHADENLTEVSANVNTVLSIVLDTSALVYRPAMTPDGSFESKSVVATVSTNSTAGYELYFSSEDTETDLVNTNTSEVISSDFSGTKTSETMELNTWGFSLDNTNFSKIPSSDNHAIIRNYNTLPSANDRRTTVNIGVKVDDSLPTGTYEKTVVFSTLAHEQRFTIFDIKYMQNMTSTVCQNTTKPDLYTGDTTNVDTPDTSKIPVTTLIDRRDGKSYTVAKFADGQCWMTDNLALELSKDTPLNALTTDLHSSQKWIPENDTQTENGNWPSNLNNAKDRSFKDNAFGMYYNWVAATAGHTSENTGSTVEDSICPKGWRLPTRNGDKSFASLINTYSFVSTDDLFSGAMNFAKTGYFPFGSGHPDGYKGWTDSGGTQYPDGGQFWAWTATTAESVGTNGYAVFAAVSGDKYPGLDSARDTIKAHGAAVRCVAR